MNEPVVGTPDVFLETQEYRRFVEFCEACRQYRYIGLCHGPPGVGKTLSARHYAQWDWVEPVLATQRAYRWEPVPRALTDCHTLLYTPTVMVTPRQVTEELNKLQRALQLAIARVLAPNVEPVELMVQALPQRTELVIVDEADRLKFSTLEQLRDCYDRGGFGLVLIGLPGLETRLARYAQFASRVGFVHQVRPLSSEALRLILVEKWHQLGVTLHLDDVTDAEAVGVIARITGGNFRLVQRLFSQIERLLAINHLEAITPQVVEAARQSLVIGMT